MNMTVIYINVQVYTTLAADLFPNLSNRYPMTLEVDTLVIPYISVIILILLLI